jgi:putative zinc finger/helix-turn-helix YgiT family protein
MSNTQKHFCDHCGDNCEVEFKVREAEYEFKGKKITIKERYPICLVCGHEVYDEETGNETLMKLKQKYYELQYNMTIEDYKRIRLNYNLNQELFAKILNWSVSTVKRYESGASLPDSTHIAIYRVLLSNPEAILNFYDETKENLTKEEREEIQESLNFTLSINKQEQKAIDLLKYIYETGSLTEINGFSFFKPKKLINLVIFYAKREVLKTKLLKLLWYTDFLYFKRYGKSMTGTTYLNYQFGPVPKKFNTMLGTLEGINKISIFEEDNVYEGYTKIIINANEEFNQNIFNNKELETIEYVDSFFKDFGSTGIANFSHQEKGWLETEEYQEISYYYAQYLNL